MELALTLISNLDAARLDHKLIKAVCGVLRSSGIKVDGEDILAPNIAADILINTDKIKEAEIITRQYLGGNPIDLALQPRNGRRKHLLIADMDSTIVTSETLDDLAAAAGIIDKVAPITERAMRGEIEFAEALRYRVNLLKGIDVSLLDQVWQQLHFTSGAATLVKTMKAHGAYTAIVSGGFTAITERVRGALGFDEDQANILIIEHGKLTGTVADPILDKNSKVSALRELADRRSLTLQDTVAVGDGANDIPLLAAAGLGVAFHAKPKVRDAAPVRIDHSDLTALLYLQGYHMADFVM